MEPDDNPDFIPCEGCGGEFYKGDLVDGDYCETCYNDLFGEDE